jgi:threonine synthase
VLLPQNAIALGKLAQALVQGATVLAVEGNFDDALRIVLDCRIAPHRAAQFAESLPP